MRDAREINGAVLWFHHPTRGLPLDSRNGVFMVKAPGRVLLTVIASDGVTEGGGWEHVSVSAPGRVPTWEEMDYVARLFWKDDEVPMQLHVGGEAKVNTCVNCLHLWRRVGKNPALPPADLV